MEIICVDFDGTCVTHAYPNIGEEIGAVPVLKKLVLAGHKLILFTMRSDESLNAAVAWFEANEIPLYGINTNPTQKNWTSSPKAYGQLYLDDAALGCPLIYDKNISERPFVNWEEIEEWLIKNKYLEDFSANLDL